MNSDRTKFFADTPFVKSVAEGSGDLILKGYASTWTLDRDQEYVERGAFDGTVEKFIQTNPILLWQHDLERPIGVVKAMVVDDNGLDVECYLPRPDDREPDWAHLAYNKVKAGIVKTFSIGGFFERVHKGAKRAIQKVDLFEVSVVSVPSNPESIFAAAVKSLEGGARPELTVAHTSQMAQLLGMHPVTDPELAMMDTDEKYARYEFLAEIYRKTGKIAPAFDAWEKVVDEKGQPVFERLDSVLSLKSMVDGSVFSETATTTQVVMPSDDTLDKGDEVLGEMKEVLAGDDEQKKGRVLSRSNEARLRRMRNEIDDLLNQIKRDEDAQENVEGDGAATASTRSIEIDADLSLDAKEVSEALLDNERLAPDADVIERTDDDGKSWYQVTDLKAKPTNLRAGDGDRSCGNCQFWRAPGDGDNGWCRKFNFPTTRTQVSDGFAAKGGNGNNNGGGG